MFQSLAKLVTGHPWRVLAVVGIVAIASSVISSGLADRLSTQGFDNPGSESSQALDRISSATNVDPSGEVIALIRVKGNVDPDGRQLAALATRKIGDDPDIARVLTPFDGERVNRELISRDGRSAVVVGYVKPGHDESGVQDRLLKAFEGHDEILMGGGLLAQDQVSTTVEKDLKRAEMIAFPLLFLLALFVFRGLIAAALPLLVGGITIPLTFAMLSLYDGVTDLSVFALNLTTGLGLGLAIDYSLLMVTRFREELATGSDPRAAVTRTIATAGRTVLFSSLTVAGSAAALCIFPLKFLYSMGMGGATVALASALAALFVLPPILLLLGHRINKFSLARRPVDRSTELWRGLAKLVMSRPGLVAISTTALLLLIGMSALGVRFTSVDATVLPGGSAPRVVQETIERDYPRGDANTNAYVVVHGGPSVKSDVSRIVRSVEALPTVAETGPPRYLGNETWRFNFFVDGARFSDEAQDAVKSVRALQTPAVVDVGGQSAAFVDQRATILNRVPLALLLIGVVTFIVLFLMTGSLVLPIKTFVMNLLTLAATFGILTLIFQDGRLEGLLDYTSQGALELTQPVLLFAIAFGLATDYGVFLLGRIKELHESGMSNNEAVAEGVARTGRVITSAALLFCVAIGAFSTSGIIFIKELGVGTALAVAIDATIVRALLVPALMVLLGDYNWWAPRPLKRIYNRFGLNEGSPAAAEASS